MVTQVYCELFTTPCGVSMRRCRHPCGGAWNDRQGRQAGHGETHLGTAPWTEELDEQATEPCSGTVRDDYQRLQHAEHDRPPIGGDAFADDDVGRHRCLVDEPQCEERYEQCNGT